jgi:hypothetical protein
MLQDPLLGPDPISSWNRILGKQQDPEVTETVVSFRSPGLSQEPVWSGAPKHRVKESHESGNANSAMAAPIPGASESCRHPLGSAAPAANRHTPLHGLVVDHSTYPSTPSGNLTFVVPGRRFVASPVSCDSCTAKSGPVEQAAACATHCPDPDPQSKPQHEYTLSAAIAGIETPRTAVKIATFICSASAKPSG